MQYRVLNGAAPEIYGRDVADGDTISLTRVQAAHLIAKGHLEPVSDSTDDAPASETPAPAGDNDALRAMLSDDSSPPAQGPGKTKGAAGGVRD